MCGKIERKNKQFFRWLDRKKKLQKKGETT